MTNEDNNGGVELPLGATETKTMGGVVRIHGPSKVALVGMASNGSRIGLGYSREARGRGTAAGAGEAVSRPKLCFASPLAG